MDKQKDVQPIGICPFMSEAPDKVVACIGAHCHLWSDTSPYAGADPGMCSIKLTAESQAFLAKGDQLREMGDRDMGGR